MENPDTAFTSPEGLMGRIAVVEVPTGQFRRDWMEAQLKEAARSGSRPFFAQCHFDEGGPWAGPSHLFSAVFEEIQNFRPDLVRTHSLELVYVMPRLRHILPIKNPTLTDLASAEERVRSYPIDRAYRILHGLIELLDEWKKATDPQTPWFVACDSYDEAGTMTQRFFIELMRRRGESMKTELLVTVKPGHGESTCRLFDSVPRAAKLQAVDLATACEVPTDPAATAHANAMHLEERIAGDRIELIANLPKLIGLWKLAGRNDKVLNYRYLALDLHNTLGLYEDSLRYAEGLLEMASTYAPENENRRWAIAGKMLNIYIGLTDVPAAVPFTERIIAEFTQHNQARLGIMLYTLAMLYARYQKPRNLEKGEEYLALGLAALERARTEGTISEDEFHFQSVFNRNGLAMIRNFQRRYPEAIQICRECVDHLNAHLAADRHLLHRSVLLYNLGQVYNAMGYHREAIERYTAAITLDPNYSEYYNDRGSVYLHSGRLQEAEADYLKAIELSPPYFEVLTNLGQCYRRMGEAEKAVQCYSRAADLEPNQVLALLGRAKAYEELGAVEKSILDYTAAITLDPSLWEAFASRGVVHYEAGNLTLSLDDLNRAIELNPNQGNLFENRATLLNDFGRRAEAERDLRTAIALAQADTDKAEVQARLDDLLSLTARA